MRIADVIAGNDEAFKLLVLEECQQIGRLGADAQRALDDGGDWETVRHYWRAFGRHASVVLVYCSMMQLAREERRADISLSAD